MSDTIWHTLHNSYKEQDWVHKPSLFAEQAIKYFPTTGKLLELGAGLGQDSCYFIEHGYDVLTTDLEAGALDTATQNAAQKSIQLKTQIVDLREELPFEGNSYDIVYAHLSLHYFDYETTVRLIDEIQRVLKPGGVMAVLANSVHDPEYNTGTQIEDDYFQIGETAKRYFSENSLRKLVQYTNINVLDEMGETYKDSAKGIHNLVRFIGTKPLQPQTFRMALPYVGAIIERSHNGTTELLLQTRWKPLTDPLYSGTLEFPAGKLDKPYENVYDALAREIKEETGLTLKAIRNDSKTADYSPKRTDKAFGFKPFCCTQQLKDGKPWIGFVFICEVEDGEPVSQLSEAKDAKWVPIADVRKIFVETPERLFGLEVPAWDYYFKQVL